MTRTYQSPLRAEQMEQTREKILEAALELTNEGQEDLTVASAAERAGISVRTAYRYFPTLDSLLDEFNVWVAKRLGVMRSPTDLADLPRFVEEAFEYFERNDAYFRAMRPSVSGKGVSSVLRSRRKVDQVKTFEKILAPISKGKDERAAKKLGGVVHTLISLDNYWNLTDVWGLTRQEAAAATMEAIDRLLATHSKNREGR